MPDIPRFYWDSCVFLSYVNADEGKVDDIESLLGYADKGEIEIVTSNVSIVEVAFGASERNQSSLSEEMEVKIKKLWQPASPVMLVEFHTLIADEAKHLIRSGVPAGWSLKPMDAVHLATAQRLKVNELHTYDEPLSKWASKVSYRITQPSPSTRKLL